MPLPQTNQPLAISATSMTDGTVNPVLGGKAGEAVVSQLRGKYAVSANRGRTFLSAGAAAGTVIVASNSTAPKFTLYNPIGSGVVAEINHLNVSWTIVTIVVSGISLGMLSQLIVAPTSITSIPVVSSNGTVVTNPQCQLYSAATLASAATRFYTLFSVSALQAIALPNFTYQFDGTMLLQPGSAVFLCGTAAQKNATLNSISWSEFPS